MKADRSVQFLHKKASTTLSEARTRDLQETLSRQLSYMLDDFDGSVS